MTAVTGGLIVAGVIACLVVVFTYLIGGQK